MSRTVYYPRVIFTQVANQGVGTQTGKGLESKSFGNNWTEG